MYTIISTDADTQTVSHLITKNRPNRAKKVDGIKSALIRMAEQNACIGFGLKHKLALFLGVETAYDKQQTEQ